MFVSRGRYIGKRLFSSNYQSILHNAQENVNQLLESNDRSSYILAQYMPEPVRNTFLAIRAFNLEVNKINEGGSNVLSRASKASSQMSNTLGISTADLKFKFWSDLLLRVFTEDSRTETDLGEPIAILLRDGLRKDFNLDISYFQKFLQTRRQFIKNSGSFQTVSDICSYGEGTYSQLNYLTQGLLLSPSISPSVIRLLEYSPELQSLISDIAAHIGQATAVSSMILGVPFYAQTRNQVTLPIDLMTSNDLSQESLLRLCQGHVSDSTEEAQIKEKLKEVVYQTAITANDHMITARDKLAKTRLTITEVLEAHPNDKLLVKQSKNWRKTIPDVIFTPMMVGIPTVLYLNKLEKCDFDLFNPKLKQKEWRLAWTSFRDYYRRTI
ncbi:NADH dehydrogenase (ubiquinone) complex I, assembly factor 6 [Candida viswanathii]|uniref:NADH dehydrogenase (Ubiquinone) complex I, assembly factor 6 n=1 Tax=Candida viswanathii TaxID=5486 RepID=A0A367Y9G6_9ASCO|nr:NADH dehydrogenase (ubiquinone) complex I, assembly factor 6 [Candida viswanathii]